MKNRFPREFYIPKGAVKVSDKQSSAVAYLYNRGDTPCAIAFAGKADKPAWRYSFRNVLQREKSIRHHFESVQAHEKSRADRSKERKAWTHDYKVGDVFGTCWGYDQTNREYFQIVEVIGKMVVLRELAQESVATGHMTWNCVPMVGRFIGEPIRRLAQQRGIKIDDVRWSSRTEFQQVAGVRIYSSASASNTH